jgi:hypothetical protein
MTFDLDPGEGVDWRRAGSGALTRTLLDELGLVSFLKTSGGKGLHVVVPLTPRDGWDAVKDFSQASCSTSHGAAAALSSRRAGRRTASAHLRRLPAQRPRRHHGRRAGRRVRGPASASRCRSTGTSCRRCAAARTGPSPTRTSGSTAASVGGLRRPRGKRWRARIKALARVARRARSG